MDWWGPMLGFVGALTASGFAFYQWRRTEQARSRTEYQADRAMTLKDLVDRLQALQVVTRQGAITRDALAEQARPLNVYLIERRHVLRQDEEESARKYLSALVELHQAILTALAA